MTKYLLAVLICLKVVIFTITQLYITKKERKDKFNSLRFFTSKSHGVNKLINNSLLVLHTTFLNSSRRDYHL